MKTVWSIAFILCLILISAFSGRAKAAVCPAGDALPQYASELSQYTGLTYFRGDYTQRYIDYKVLYPAETWENVITYVNIGLDSLFYSNASPVVNPSDTWVMINKYRPLPSDFIPAQLEAVGKPYSYGPQKLRRSARLAFERMCADTKALGYPIWATSSYRSYDKQAEVYASFFNPEDPSSVSVQDQLAARPGFSEHQTGLAVDISRVDASVKSADINKWLAKNAYRYGFIVRYPVGKEGVTGYANEPWHLRYLGVKLATAVYKSKLTYDEYYMRVLDIPPLCTDTRAVGVTTATNVTITSLDAPDSAVTGAPAGGNTVQLAAYEVLGARYYRLRDIAVLLSGTPAQFNISWDPSTGMIGLHKGAAYTGDPALVSFEPGRAALVTAVKPGLLSDSAAYDLQAYSSAGSNYFKLEDILSILGITSSGDGLGGLQIDAAVPHGAESNAAPAETLPAPVT